MSAHIPGPALHESLLDVVGGTPLVRSRRLAAGTPARVYVKLEYLNPGGSVKDRAASAMVAPAEASGALGPGGTIVEGTSGNTGVGLAQAAAVRGYRLVAVLPDVVAREKTDTLIAYGAEVVLTLRTCRASTRTTSSRWRAGSPTGRRAAGWPTSTTIRPTRGCASRRPDPRSGATPAAR